MFDSISVGDLFHQDATEKSTDLTLKIPGGDRLQFTLAEPLTARLLIRPINLTDILVTVAFKAHLQTHCDRCLQPLIYPVKVTFEELFSLVPSETASPIASDMTISIIPSIIQEIDVHTPYQVFCLQPCQILENT